ncbi:hypothetical protein ACOME3_003183 [Neoechinorhynchus agilis]
MVNPISKMEFANSVNMVKVVAPVLRSRQEKLALLTICGANCRTHTRDGSPANFARLRALLSMDEEPSLTSPPPVLTIGLGSVVHRFWHSVPFEVVWLQLHITTKVSRFGKQK